MKLKIGRFFSIDLFVHWSFIALPIYAFYRWKIQAGMDWGRFGMTLLVISAVFLFVILHEYGHALAARYFGVKTVDILITPIGGLARLERMPKRPIEEFMITLAGPMVNLVLAGIGAVVVLLLGGGFGWDDITGSVAGAIGLLVWLNLFLFGFNMIPAFPMDGGRLLRSTLHFFVSHWRATQIATWVGIVFGGAFVVYGLINSDFTLVLVGAFVAWVARSELRNANRLQRWHQANSPAVGE